MTFSELITSIVLGIMGVSLIALFLRIFLQALSLHFGGSPNSFFNKFQKQDFTKRALRMFKLKLLNAKHFDPKLLEEANKALQAEEINRAIDLFRKCFVLQPFFSDPEAFKTTHQHNLKLLARVVEVARDRGTRVENAALLEGLFQSRGELFLSYFETEHAKEEFRRNNPQLPEIFFMSTK